MRHVRVVINFDVDDDVSDEVVDEILTAAMVQIHEAEIYDDATNGMNNIEIATYNVEMEKVS